MLLQHALVNGFNVGAVSRLSGWDELKPLRAYAPKRRPSKAYRFRPLRLGKPPAQGPSPREWTKEFRERRLLELYGPLVDSWGHYAVPTTRRGDRDYASSVCQATQAVCITYGDNPRLLRQLDESRLWYDAAHLTARGARVYTRWLAERIDKLGVLRR
jgi:hypothetical protein